MAKQPQMKCVHVVLHAAPALLLAVLIDVVWQRHIPAIVLGCIGACVMLCGLCAPEWYRRWNRMVHALVTAIIQCVTWVLLSAVYVCVVTPIRLMRVVLRRDTLKLRFPARDSSFWHTHHDPDGRDSYRRQY